MSGGPILDINGKEVLGILSHEPDDPFASQRIFDEYDDLGIEPVFYPAFFYCKKCLSFASERNCPHGPEHQEQLSGTKLRTMILDKQSPSEYMIRPEVSKIIMSWDKPFVE